MEEHMESMEQAAEARDYAAEVEALFQARPELRGGELPGEVLTACVGGKRLTDAYSDYAKARQQADTEDRVQRQNAKAAAQAPVRGVTRGGSTDPKPEDAFLQGFNADR